MPLPPVPRELDTSWPLPLEEQLWSTIQNVQALFIYLQRLRDQNADTIADVIENDPSLAGGNFIDSNTIDFTVTAQGVTAEVLNDTAIQRIEIASNGALVSTRKQLNIIGNANIVDNAAQNRADITISSVALSRVVLNNLTLHNTECIISSRYFEVQGVLELAGDATLEVL